MIRYTDWRTTLIRFCAERKLSEMAENTITATSSRNGNTPS
jgi:hypothetical protein